MITAFVLSLISFYQKYLSLVIKMLLGTPRICYQTPTCSEYTKQVIRRYGIVTGLRKGLVRIFTCRPSLSSYA